MHLNAADMSPETIGKDTDAAAIDLEVFDRSVEPTFAVIWPALNRSSPTCWRGRGRSCTPVRRPRSSVSPSAPLRHHEGRHHLPRLARRFDDGAETASGPTPPHLVRP